MTTDELVAKVVEALSNGDKETFNAFSEYVRSVTQTSWQSHTQYVWSVALNDETYDVRYVELITCEDEVKGLASEVFPVTVVKTEYRRK